MSGENLQRLRDLILDCCKISGIIIEFDTFKALENGYSQDEITIANNILLNSSGFCLHNHKLKEDIMFIFGENDDKPIAFHVDVVKIIFVISVKRDIYTHIFEEDLEKEVIKKKEFIEYFEYVTSEIRNDAYGEPL